MSLYNITNDRFACVGHLYICPSVESLIITKVIIALHPSIHELCFSTTVIQVYGVNTTVGCISVSL